MTEQEKLLAKIKAENENQLNAKVEAFKTELFASMESKTIAKGQEAAQTVIDAFLLANKPEKLEDNEKFISALQTIESLKSNAAKNENPKTFAEALVGKQEEITAIFKSNGAPVEIDATLTQRSSVSETKKATTLGSIGQLAVRTMPMLDLIREEMVTSNDDNGTIYYYDWDQATIIRAAAVVAEGETFPESTAKFKWYKIDLIKIGDTMPVTEEFFEDAAPFAAQLKQFLLVNMQLVEDQKLLRGTGIDDIEGVLTFSPEYVPSSKSQQDANMLDLAVYMKSDITDDTGNKYRPNFMMVNSDTINDIILAKDANNNYLRADFLTFTAEGYPVVKGMVVIENNEMTSEELVIGDAMYMSRHSKKGILITEGEVDKQFVQDTKTLKARKRTLLLARYADRGAFRKCTAITTALTTIGA